MIYKCKICGKEFTPQNYRNVCYCSEECKKEGNRRNQPRHRHSGYLYTRTCPVCLEEFKTNHAQKVFCCADCAEEYRQIAAEVLLKRRPVIRKMLEKVAANPAIDINELIKKEYPKI